MRGASAEGRRLLIMGGAKVSPVDGGPDNVGGANGMRSPCGRGHGRVHV